MIFETIQKAFYDVESVNTGYIMGPEISAVQYFNMEVTTTLIIDQEYIHRLRGLWSAKNFINKVPCMIFETIQKAFYDVESVNTGYIMGPVCETMLDRFIQDLQPHHTPIQTILPLAVSTTIQIHIDVFYCIQESTRIKLIYISNYI